MKKVHLLVSIFSVCFAFGQKTVQFSDPLPPNSSSITTVDKAFFGQYKEPKSGTTYVIDPSGISIVSVVVASITREQLRESSQLQVRGDYLFGIAKNDSLPCVLEGERYYYGLPQKLLIVGEGSLNTLNKISANSYIINFHEGAYFEPSTLTFNPKSMTISHSELKDQEGFSSILKVNTITRYGSEVLILAPTFEQWERLQKLIFTGDKITYVKE